MSFAIRLPAVPALLACALLSGCPKDGKDGATGADGANALVQLTTEPAGANCANGGTRIQAGIDANRNATLDPAEVSTTQYVCNGATGHAALLASTPEPSGANCAAGGTRIQAGTDLDDDATLDANEVGSTQYACHGAAGADGADGHVSLVAITLEAAGANCTYGGTRIESGVDADDSATLEPSEVVLTQFACNGATGLASLVETSSEPAGTNCAHGGTRIDSGVDVDRSGVLEGDEITSTQFACNGADGKASLQVMTPEPEGTNCANGGVRIVSGLDADSDGTLDPSEEGTPQYVCNGAPGADGQTSLVVTADEPAGANCQYGGILVRSGLDADGDGLLAGSDAVVERYVCDGAPGADGAPAPEALVVTSPEAAGANCAVGGTRIEFATDANANGVIDPGELDSTAYACTGATGATGPTLDTVLGFTPEPAGANCPYGGTKVESGIDLNSNGVLDPGEATSTGYVCDGDAVHPQILGVVPSPGTVPMGTDFCVAFSEPMDSATLDASSIQLRLWGAPIAASVSYDPATLTACLDPTAPLSTYYGYDFSVGESGTIIRDLSGNALIGKFLGTYSFTAPNLRVVITSLEEDATPGTWNVGYTVSNVDYGDAGPFTVGFFVDPILTPDVGSTPDFSADFPGLAALGSQAASIQLPAGALTTLLAFVDVYGAVAETAEYDNLGVLLPTLTGAVVAIPTSVEEGAQLTLTIPVNQSTRFASIWLGSDYWGGGSSWLGEFPGNAAGEGFITATATIPVGAGLVGGTWSVWVQTLDANRANETMHVALSAYSVTNLVKYDYGVGGWLDTGIPLTFVSVTPSTAPNLRVAIRNAVVAAGGGIDVTFRVDNVGAGPCGPFSVGVYVDPLLEPGVGVAPTLATAIPGLAATSGTAVTVNVPGRASSRVLAYADIYGEVAETDETDNLALTPAKLLGSPVVSPNPVELGGGFSLALPVNIAARDVTVELGTTEGAPTRYLGNVWGNYDGEGTISGTIAVPDDVTLLGPWTLVVTTWDDAHLSGRRYVLSPTYSETAYSAYDPSTGYFTNLTTFPITTVTVVAASHPNLTVSLGVVTDGVVPGTIDVPYTVTNTGAFDAAASTLGFYVDPANAPVLGDVPTATADIVPLPAGTSVSDTMTLTATRIDRVLAFADALGAVVETNEGDNLAWPPPMLRGAIEATPAVVDEGTLLTLRLPVTGTAFNAEIYLGVEGMGGISLGYLSGNWENQGFIDGALVVPTGYTWLGTTSVWVNLRDDYGRYTTSYTEMAAIAPGDLALPYPGTSTWVDSGIPLTYVQIVPATRPNLSVTIDGVTALTDGSVNLDYTVRNTGAGAAGPFVLGFFVDPPAVPGPGSTPSGSLPFSSLAVGESASATINLPGDATSALFAYADLGGAVDEQSETDNLAWRVPPPLMTGQPVTVATIAVGDTFDVTVPVGTSVRSLEVYVGSTTMMGGGPGYLIGAASGNAAGEGSITVPCTAPVGSAGDWWVWVAAEDGYGVAWLGFGTEVTISTTNYTQYDPATDTLTPTSIPLTALTITP